MQPIFRRFSTYTNDYNDVIFYLFSLYEVSRFENIEVLTVSPLLIRESGQDSQTGSGSHKSSQIFKILKDYKSKKADPTLFRPICCKIKVLEEEAKIRRRLS